MPHTKEFYEQRLPQDPYSGHFRLQSQRDAVRGWLGHVEAGRLGEGAQMTGEQRAVLAHNERLMFGDPVDRIW